MENNEYSSFAAGKNTFQGNTYADAAVCLLSCDFAQEAPPPSLQQMLPWASYVHISCDFAQHAVGCHLSKALHILFCLFIQSRECREREHYNLPVFPPGGPQHLCWISGLGIHSFADRSFAHLLIAHLLISLKWNKRLWAIHSDRSIQISDSERIAQVAQRKWATVSDSLRSLRGNERCERIAHFTHQKWANEWFAQKIWLKKSKILFYYVLYKIFQQKKI